MPGAPGVPTPVPEGHVQLGGIAETLGAAAGSSAPLARRLSRPLGGPEPGLGAPTGSTSASKAAKAPARSVAPLRTSQSRRAWRPGSPGHASRPQAGRQPARFPGRAGPHGARPGSGQRLGIIAGNTSRASSAKTSERPAPMTASASKTSAARSTPGGNVGGSLNQPPGRPSAHRSTGAAVETPAAQANDLTFGTW